MARLMCKDAVEQAAVVSNGSATPRDLVDDAIAAIEELNPRVNAVIHPLYVKARQQATSGPGNGRFHGVPMLVKDAVCHTQGDPFHVGMRLLRDLGWTEQTDTYLASRFRQAGFLIVGKTNTPELATAYTTEPLAYGPTRNPWDTTRSAGGSSGGSAAAVACGMVAVAHGNDMGGSIRVPASECGVVGLKPTRGRITLGPDFGEYWGMLTHEGVLTRTVTDTAETLDAIAGSAIGDPYRAEPPDQTFAEACKTDPPRVRIGFRTTLPMLKTSAHHDCTAAVDQTAALLAQLGHDVNQTSAKALDDTAMSEQFLNLFSASVARDLDRWAARTGQAITEDDVEPRNWMLAEHGRRLDAASYIAAVEYLHLYARRVSTMWTDFDLLLTPTIPEPPPLLGRLSPRPTPQAVAHLGEFTAPFNVTGQPAISLPMARNRHELPIGVQLVAGYGKEGLLLAVARQLERAADWSLAHPPVSVWGAGHGSDAPESLTPIGGPGSVESGPERRTDSWNGTAMATRRGPRQS